MRALVIGINHYRHANSLMGAVDDARDIANALRRQGVEDLTVLVDDDATRDAVDRSWSDVLARSATGDTIVLTFAGHGTQEPERLPGSEADGKDEVLLLGGFAPSGPGTRERIIDDELNAWFQDADRRGVAVIFVADACHSGTLTRSVDARVGPVSYRYTSPYTITGDMLQVTIPMQVATLTENDLPSVFFLAAAQDNQVVPEILLPGPNGKRGPRGALSYSFARALEGAGDANHDGIVTRGELRAYVENQVRILSESRQTPNVLPLGADTRSAFPTPPAGGDGDANAGDAIRIAIAGVPDDEARHVLDSLPGAVLVASGDHPDLIWDPKSLQVLGPLGDVLAYRVELQRLPDVVDRMRLLNRLGLASHTSRLQTRVTPDDSAHRYRERVGFRIEGLRNPYLTVFSVSGDGTLQFLYPVSGDPPSLGAERRFEVQFQVTPPFGADHIVAITTAEPPTILQRMLKRFSGQPATQAIANALAPVLADPQGQIGIQGLFTRP